jgi:ubiquinone/menaquinone biosynthesis C-methylase UbiE
VLQDFRWSQVREVIGGRAPEDQWLLNSTSEVSIMSDTQVSAQPRSQYVDFWNNILVPKFVRWRHILVGGLTLHSERIFPSLPVNQGDRVVDAGCGFGDTAIELARLVGSTGSVLAVDCCDGFLEYGRREAGAAGLSNVTFLEADVQSYPFEPVHDFCFSRFGTQFFENPVAGLRNMRTSLKPGGIMTMVVWRGIKDNPWLGHAKDIVLKFLPPPGENAQTCGPGPFSMADTDVVTKQLEIAGYRDIEFEQIDAQVFVGNDLDDAVAFQLAIGPAGEVYREAGKLAEERHEKIANALKAELAKSLRPNGVMMGSSSWKVTAKNPG